MIGTHTRTQKNTFLAKNKKDLPSPPANTSVQRAGGTVGLTKRPTVPLTLCTSAFADGDGRSVGLVAKKWHTIELPDFPANPFEKY